MKKNLFLRILSLCLVFMLVTATALTLASCNEKENNASESESEAPSENANEAPSESENTAQKTFTLEVTFADGTTETKECQSEAEMLGTFLRDEKLVEGTESEEYGLMITSVMGEAHDYDTDKSYWAFFIDGEYAMTGVDSTPIEEGAIYALKAEVSQ